MRDKIKNLMIALTLAVSASCATIMGEPNQLTPISSVPDKASVIITDEKGKEVFKGATPVSVSLQKSDGSYWGGKDYIVKISKPGYKTREISINSEVNGWYIAGNLLFGGPIGWFIVDPMNGHMYTLSPEEVDASLSSENAGNRFEDGAISIVMIEDVPADLRARMKRVK